MSGQKGEGGGALYMKFCMFSCFLSPKLHSVASPSPKAPPMAHFLTPAVDLKSRPVSVPDRTDFASSSSSRAEKRSIKIKLKPCGKDNWFLPVLWIRTVRIFMFLGRVRKLKEDFVGFFLSMYDTYSTLLHLPPLRFRCIGGCWDRTQDSCEYGTGCQTL
jgi:hypothetical protein